MECKARLRGLWRIWSQNHHHPCRSACSLWRNHGLPRIFFVLICHIRAHPCAIHQAISVPIHVLFRLSKTKPAYAGVTGFTDFCKIVADHW